MEFEDDGLSAWHHHEELLQQRYEIEVLQRNFQNQKETTMGFIATDRGSGDRKYENAPAGAHAARCYRVIDLGTQTFQVKGETKQAWQCILSWELAKKMEDGTPYTVNEKYTVSTNSKAKLAAILEGWRGRPFTEEERKRFEMKNVLGKYCLLNIVHTNRGDRTYANVVSAMPIPDGMTSPAPVNAEVYYSLSDHDAAVYEKLPKYYQETIAKSPEYQNRSVKTAAPVAVAAGEDDELNDDIPF